MLHSILSRRVVAREDLKKGQKLKFKDIKTVLTYSNKGCYPNKIFSLINRKLKSDLISGSPIDLSMVR